MIVFFALAIVIGTLFYVINLLVYKTGRSVNSNTLLISTYECGFEAITNQSRVEHSISYYVIALLYVIFDLEIALVLPALISFTIIGSSGVILLLTIMTLLCLAFVYELKLGALSHV